MFKYAPQAQLQHVITAFSRILTFLLFLMLRTTAMAMIPT